MQQFFIFVIVFFLFRKLWWVIGGVCLLGDALVYKWVSLVGLVLRLLVIWECLIWGLGCRLFSTTTVFRCSRLGSCWCILRLWTSAVASLLLLLLSFFFLQLILVLFLIFFLFISESLYRLFHFILFVIIVITTFMIFMFFFLFWWFLWRLWRGWRGNWLLLWLLLLTILLTLILILWLFFFIITCNKFAKEPLKEIVNVPTFNLCIWLDLRQINGLYLLLVINWI